MRRRPKITIIGAGNVAQRRLTGAAAELGDIVLVDIPHRGHAQGQGSGPDASLADHGL